MVGVVVDEGIGLVDGDVEEAVDDVIGLPYPTLLGVGAGEDEEEEERYDGEFRHEIHEKSFKTANFSN